MKKLIIYTKPSCRFCNLTKSFLTENNIAYTEIDVSSNEDMRQLLRDKGHKTLPVIYADDKPLVEDGYSELVVLGKDKILERLEY